MPWFFKMNILICDDSSLARNSLYRCISPNLAATTYFCENGFEALEMLQEQDIDLMFLDLTMPVMDGYEVLESLPVSSYQTHVVVLSGDTQGEAKRRCIKLGATSFIEKPFKPEMVHSVIHQYTTKSTVCPTVQESPEPQYITPINKYKEIANIALGKGAAVISDRTNTFIELPVPSVGVVEASELNMIISDAIQRDSVHAVTQRFVGYGIHGESLVCMQGSGIIELGRKLGFSTEESNYSEIVSNVANLLVSTYLNSLAGQLVINFSLRQPVTVDANAHEHLVGHHIRQRAFTTEFTYFAEQIDFECEILLLLDSDSVETLYKLMERL